MLILLLILPNLTSCYQTDCAQDIRYLDYPKWLALIGTIPFVSRKTWSLNIPAFDRLCCGYCTSTHNHLQWHTNLAHINLKNSTKTFGASWQKSEFLYKSSKDSTTSKWEMKRLTMTWKGNIVIEIKLTTFMQTSANSLVSCSSNTRAHTLSFMSLEHEKRRSAVPGEIQAISQKCNSIAW